MLTFPQMHRFSINQNVHNGPNLSKHFASVWNVFFSKKLPLLFFCFFFKGGKFGKRNTDVLVWYLFIYLFVFVATDSSYWRLDLPPNNFTIWSSPLQESKWMQKFYNKLTRCLHFHTPLSTSCPLIHPTTSGWMNSFVEAFLSRAKCSRHLAPHIQKVWDLCRMNWVLHLDFASVKRRVRSFLCACWGLLFVLARILSFHSIQEFLVSGPHFQFVISPVQWNPIF